MIEVVKQKHYMDIERLKPSFVEGFEVGDDIVIQEKIDGAIATIMALDRAVRCGNVNTESVYDSRGILFI